MNKDIILDIENVIKDLEKVSLDDSYYQYKYIGKCISYLRMYIACIQEGINGQIK